MQRFHYLNQMNRSKLTVVIRGETLEEAEKSAEACVKGGVKSLEVTFTIPGAHKLIEKLVSKYGHVLTGAGTVLDNETARIAILSGAKFIVSPTFNKNTAKLCNRYSIPYIPGCMTVNEIAHAMEYGVSITKLFPGQLFAPSFIKNVKGALPNINVMPTGGITIDNVQSWLNAGAISVGIGGEITRPGEHGDFQQVESLAIKFLDKIEGVDFWDK